MPERGRLAEMPLPRLLLDLERRRFDGRLVLARGRVTKRIRLRGGCPIHADSTRPNEALAAALEASGTLTPDQAREVAARAREREVGHEAVLLELGLLAPRQLLAALRDHAARLLLDCFAWDDAEFSLEPGEAAANGAALLRLEPLRLALEGIASRWPAERTFAALADKLGCYPVAVAAETRRLARLAPDSPVRRLLDGLDGQCTLDQAIRSAGSADAAAAAWVLDAGGMLSYQREPVTEKMPSEPAPDGATDTEPELEIVVSRAEAPASSGAADSGTAKRADPGDRAKQDEAEALMLEIHEKHGRLAELDYYELLGVARDAKPTGVKRAYFTAAKRFHPDALSRLGLDGLKPRASEVFARMAKAYDVLSNYDQRREYDASLEDGGDDAEAARLVQAETLFRKGEILLRSGNFAGALEFLGPAVQLWPEDATYQGTLGWALFRSSAQRAKDALPYLERAIELEPNDATGHQRLGAVLRALGQNDAAQRAFARAHQLDPTKHR